MKKILLLIIFCFFLACSNKHNDVSSDIDQSDSLKTEILKHKRIDSLLNIRDEIEKSEGNRILGNLYFGISSTEWKKQSQLFYKSLEDSEGRSRISDFVLGKHTFIHNWKDDSYLDITDKYRYVYNRFPFNKDKGHYKDECNGGASFYKDSLFNVTLIGISNQIYLKEAFSDLYSDKNDNPYIYSLERSINERLQSLYNFLSKKYGEADANTWDQLNFEFRKWSFNTQPNIFCGWKYDNVQFEWDMRRKKIKVYIHEYSPHSDNPDYCHMEYWVCLSITDKSLAERMVADIHKEVISLENSNMLRKEQDDKINREAIEKL